MLGDRTSLSKYCHDNAKQYSGDDKQYFGVRVDTDNHTYLLRLNPNRGEYNLYCYCYVKKYLETQLVQASKGDYVGSLVTRVESLTNGLLGQIFTGNAIEDTVLFDENTIIDLSRIGSAETKALLMGVLVLKLSEYRQSTASGTNCPVKHITILEEAHNLLKRTSTEQGQESANVQGKSVEMISNSIMSI